MKVFLPLSGRDEYSQSSRGARATPPQPHHQPGNGHSQGLQSVEWAKDRYL